MATVGDGVRIGLGLLIFKLIFSVGGCAVLIGTCSYVFSESEKVKQKEQQQREEAKKVDLSKDGVTFKDGCTVREEANKKSKKLWRAEAGKRYILLDSSDDDKWLWVENEEGVTGWAGCSNREKHPAQQ
jgi:metal-dependent hydrolase (beta-lactamase superfamily II)